MLLPTLTTRQLIAGPPTYNNTQKVHGLIDLKISLVRG